MRHIQFVFAHPPSPTLSLFFFFLLTGWTPCASNCVPACHCLHSQGFLKTNHRDSIALCLILGGANSKRGMCTTLRTSFINTYKCILKSCANRFIHQRFAKTFAQEMRRPQNSSRIKKKMVSCEILRDCVNYCMWTLSYVNLS